MCIVGFYKEVDLIMDGTEWFKGFKGASTPLIYFLLTVFGYANIWGLFVQNP